MFLTMTSFIFMNYLQTKNTIVSRYSKVLTFFLLSKVRSKGFYRHPRYRSESNQCRSLCTPVLSNNRLLFQVEF